MGQSQASLRLKSIKDNVEEIMERIRCDELTVDDRNRSHHILIDYIKELNLILSKSLRASRIRKVEKLIIAALEEVATLEGKFKSIEPRLRSKSLQTLHDIERNTRSLGANLKNQTLEREKNAIRDYKKRISLIGDVDYEVGATKSKVLDAVFSVEQTLNEMEIEEKLKMVEEKHNLGRLDLGRFVGVSQSKSYKKHRKFLFVLKREIDEIPDVNINVSERKKYLLFNIENNITALERRVVLNEDKIRRKAAYTNQTLPQFIQYYNEFEKSFTANCSLNELQDVVAQLKEVKTKIEMKLKVLENQVNPEGDFRNQQIKIEDVCALKENLQEYKNEVDDTSPGAEHEHVSKVIDIALRNLAQITMERSSKTGDTLIDVMSISSNITDIGSRIQMISTLQDCDFIERELLENLHYLRKLEIPFSRSNVCQLRDYTLIQIDSHLSNLGKVRRKVCPEIVQTRNEEMLSF